MFHDTHFLYRPLIGHRAEGAVFSSASPGEHNNCFQNMYFLPSSHYHHLRRCVVWYTDSMVKQTINKHTIKITVFSFHLKYVTCYTEIALLNNLRISRTVFSVVHAPVLKFCHKIVFPLHWNSCQICFLCFLLVDVQMLISWIL